MKKNQLDFDSVYEEFHKKISLYLERMVGKGQAEDLTQEVFIRIHSQINTLKDCEKIRAWMLLTTQKAMDCPYP